MRGGKKKEKKKKEKCDWVTAMVTSQNRNEVLKMYLIVLHGRAFLLEDED